MSLGLACREVRIIRENEEKETYGARTVVKVQSEDTIGCIPDVTFYSAFCGRRTDFRAIGPGALRVDGITIASVGGDWDVGNLSCGNGSCERICPFFGELGDIGSADRVFSSPF